MATLKEVQTKISAVKKTKQITQAMNMVATSRLRNAQMAMNGFLPYAAKFADVLGSLAEKAGENASPLLIAHEEVKKIHIVLCTSDRGLCGGFNLNLINKAMMFIKDKPGGDVEFSFTCFGKKGRDWCKKEKNKIADEYIGVVGGKIDFNVASGAGSVIVEGFLDGTYDEVYIISAEYVHIAKQIPLMKQLIPIPPIEKVEEVNEEDTQFMAEHICEPSPEELLEDLLPRNVYSQIYKGLLETSASEHAARMTAMSNATKACNDLIDNLTLLYNKARQASITADLMDIVGGAEALKG